MYRPRIEKLEERRLFSVTDLIIDPFSAAKMHRDTPAFVAHSQPAIVDFVDADEISTPLNRRSRTESVSKDESITIGGNRTESVIGLMGDFNGDGRFDVIANRNQDIAVEKDEAHLVAQRIDAPRGLLSGTDGGIWRNNRVAGDFNRDGIPDATTVFQSHTLPHSDGLVLDAVAATSYASESRPTDSFSLNIAGQSVNGIIGMLIDGVRVNSATPTGTVTFGRVVDPSKPNVVYLGGSRAFLTGDPLGPTYMPSQVSFCFGDGSPRFIRVDTTGMVDTDRALLASPEYHSNVAASLLGSEEHFSRFANTTFDDEGLVATTYGRGAEASQVTHDEEFEGWANASRFDRGYLSLGYTMSDLLVSSIRAARGDDRIANAG